MLLLMLILMTSDPDKSKQQPSLEEPTKSAPAAAQKMCKDVLGRTVRCNPY